MDLAAIFRSYLEKSFKLVTGYKALILDQQSMRMCSTVYSQTELSQNDIFLIEVTDKNKDGKQHMELKAVCFLRPTRENIAFLSKELRNPRFQEYHIFFTNTVMEHYQKDLAMQDQKQLIVQVQEFYGDYIVLEPHMYLIPIIQNQCLLANKFSLQAGESQIQHLAIDRMTQGLSALFLSLKRRPAIRYRANSELCAQLAQELYQHTYEQERELFDFGVRGQQANPVLLILDRRDDPVSCLLSQWTYQSMLHELLTLNDNKIDLTKSPLLQKNGVVPEMQQFVASSLNDEFFSQHMFSNYGDTALAVQQLWSKFQKEKGEQSKLQNLEDIGRFINQYHNFSNKEVITQKHAILCQELSRIVSKRKLLDYLATEQELATNAGGSSTDHEEIQRALQDQELDNYDKLRLGCLFILKYEHESDKIQGIVIKLGQIDDSFPQICDALIRYAGRNMRRGDLYGNRSQLGLAGLAKNLMQNMKETYQLHTPLLAETIRQAKDNQLSAYDYPYIGDQRVVQEQVLRHKNSPPKEGIVFIVGGITYEEFKAIEHLNKRQDFPMQIILGGSEIINSKLLFSNISQHGQFSSKKIEANDFT